MERIISINKGTAESNQTVTLGNLLLRGWISPLGTPNKYLYLLIQIFTKIWYNVHELNEIIRF